VRAPDKERYNNKDDRMGNLGLAEAIRNLRKELSLAQDAAEGESLQF
jgi:hypothetical protein